MNKETRVDIMGYIVAYIGVIWLCGVAITQSWTWGLFKW